MSTNMKKIKRDLKNVEEDSIPTPAEEDDDSKMTENNPSYTRFPSDTVREIWLNIFEKLDPTDKITFARACPIWYDWVAPKRTQQLFAEEVAPRLMETVPKKGLIQCRQLCKMWTQELDHQLSSHPSNLQLELEKDAFDKVPELHNNFSATKDIVGFMEMMKIHPGNPFPTRNIKFYRSDFPDIEEENERVEFFTNYNSNVFLLLDMFGKHVHYASVACTTPTLSALENAAHIRNILLRLPNLRGLELFGLPEDEAIDNENEAIQDFYLRNPLPQLNYLESLELDGDYGPLHDNILRSCCVPANMKRLMPSSAYDDRVPGHLEGFVNLEVLDTTLDLQHLQRLGSLEAKPPLRRLSVELNGSVEYQQIVAAVEPFASTLIHFELHSSLVVPNNVGMLFNLPNLTRFHCFNYTGSLDPLLQLRNLNFLRIGMYRIENEDAGPYVVDLHEMMEGNIYESNIWNLIPSLNTLVLVDEELESKVYKRRMGNV